MGARYLTAAQTATVLRKALKARWPHVKFSVRSQTYSGGASIRVRWADGPAPSEVEKVTAGFEAGGFDGMIDMAYGITSWLLPDGTATMAASPGTEGSRGMVASYVSDAPHPDAVLVTFGAKYISCDRTETDYAGQHDDAMNLITQQCHVENGQFGNRWIDHLASSMVNTRKEHETMRDAFERVVIHNGRDD